MLSKQQIPLQLTGYDKFSFELYLAGCNQHICQHLQRYSTGEETKNIYLWGKPGTGKSHLLQASCCVASQHGKRVAYLPLSNYKAFSIDILDGLEQLDLICIDDIQYIANNMHWEQAIFHLFNRLREAHKPLLISASSSPQGLPIKLLDLKSRLAWDIVYHLHELTEKEKKEALIRRADHRGFHLPSEVTDYLLRYTSRNTHSLFLCLDQLDRASLSEQRKLTVPFVKRTLDPLDGRHKKMGGGINETT